MRRAKRLGSGCSLERGRHEHRPDAPEFPGPRIALGSAAVLWMALACTDPAGLPPGVEEASVDSAKVRAGLAPTTPPADRGGPLMAPPAEGTSSDPLVLDSVGGFEIELDARECAAPNVELWVISPVEELLTATACQETVGTTWTTAGPFEAGTEVVLHVVPNFGGAPGAFIESGSYPNWSVRVEAGFDFDFNDLELLVSATAPDTVFGMTLTPSATVAHPWIPEMTINGLDQDPRPGDTISLTAFAAVWTIPENEVDVSVTAEFLANDSAGHAHQTTRVAFTDVPDAQSGFPDFGDLVGNPWTGFFRFESADYDTFEAETASGALAFEFIAGSVSGDVQVIASTTVDSVLYADTVDIRIQVPDLVNDTLYVGDAYFIGGTTAHALGPNLHVTQSVALRMQQIALAMAGEEPGFYVQHNDASLPWGGTFTVLPTGQGTGANPLAGGHRSHALGQDIDIAWCYTDVAGFDPSEDDRVSGTNCSATEYVNPDTLQVYTDAVGACAAAHASNSSGVLDHYHIHFGGSCPS